MNREGLPIEVTSDGGFQYDNTVVTEEEFDRVYELCEKELMKAGAIGPPPAADPEYLSAVYDELVEQAQCLTDEGYTVEEPPSRETWIESKGAAWDPWGSVAENDGVEALEEAQATCG
ncbi:hypothetical protein [Brachybacterium sp. UMB0905]|uniref:hypothetical protein n=1 Tax=Brachybacterium sp. UMB0905 TaxID=2069310 RepID=UPI000C80D3D7|nr:hypothetical protein [Brachybacterium sp. UMB0905]PMC75024.1 hypothetical protein CJ197_09895 [Brachybacterium sp. UMB0905]